MNYDLYVLTLEEAPCSETQERKTEWLLDSGATVSATFDEADCHDIVPCDIQVKAAGTCFQVLKKGRARIATIDANGEACHFLVRECLISEKFPVLMRGPNMAITTPLFLAPEAASSHARQNLHLKYGHRSFPDLSKASCIMGKSHIQPHYTGDTPRASRRAEGFHSDFRGPFSTPAPNGELYLLTR